MLHLHTSNQLEQLATQYARITNEPLKNVFEAELLVVQNAGMARYLSMHVADLSGISANTEALFPAEFMWKLLRLVSPNVSKQSECSPEALRFHIMQELTDNSTDYPEILHYIIHKDKSNKDELNEASTWDLSSELSQLLDQYLFYRSDWIREWEAGDVDSTNWQARLWNRCIKGKNKDKNLTHWLTLQDQFKNAFESMDVSNFPERVSFFSMSALSPGYLDLLGELAKKIEVHLYIINPCEDVYWGDIASEKTRAKLPLEKQDYVDVGNPLLASMGTQGRDFVEQLLNTPHIEKNTLHSSDPNDQNNITLLNKLQNDIFNLQQPEKIENVSIDSLNNNSITFNACHTAMREVEVLHDQILNALDNDSTLAPADIVVMMPDIEKYAPYIEAIFSSPTNLNTKQKLPFSIADRNPLNAVHMIEALHKVLLLSDTRFDVESVFELLDCDEIRTQFNLDENQVIQCRKLAKSTNIRWGINADYRKQNDLPATEEHTWKYALDRILLGYALGDAPDNHSETSEQLFESATNPDLPLLAYNDIEGSNAVMLADFKRFTDTIFRINQWNHQSHTVIDWLDKTKALIAQLFSENSDYQLIIKPLDNIKNNALLTDFKKELSFAVFQKLLIESLQKITGTEKYLGHGITFCALVPMRSVPFKVVALMGMNDGEFPRQDKRHSFDLMAGQSRKGDRSRRDEDRYLFLESILATRSRLIISYTGQSVHDNSTLPPSVLVSELLDTLAIYTGKKPESFICKHPLQAFSPRYFIGGDGDNDTLFSYANEYVKLHTENKSEAPSDVFISERLTELDDSYKNITLDELIKFYQNPARSFLQQRFSIQTFDDDITLPIREPFEIEFFKDREVRELIMPCDEGSSHNAHEAKLIARAKGLLPYGEIGDAIFNNEKQTIEAFKAQLPELELEESQSFSLTLGDFQLHGKLNNLTTSGRVVQQVTSPYFRDYIDLWLTHLALNTQVATPSTFYSPDLKFTLSAIENADEILKKLLHFYWQGLHFPLSFFPKSGFAMYKDKGSENKNQATAEWQGGNQKAGDKDKFEHWLLHRSQDLKLKEPLTTPEEEFLSISQLIFGEMYDHLAEL
jgi:exodeoxyribonuclease V gamma subunit